MKKILEDIVDYLSSVRFTLVVLIALAVVAAAGTFVGQNRPPQEYVVRFGHSAYEVLTFLSVTDIYHSPYFNALLMLLVANITLCTLTLAPKRIRALLAKKIDEPTYPLSETLVTGYPKDEAAEISRKAIGPILRRTIMRRERSAATIVSVPHPVLGLGPIIVHVSIVLIIIGGLISFLFGFSGDMLILEGGQSREMLVRNKYLMELDFAVRLDRFTLTRYRDGTPKEYRSDITFLDGDEKVSAALLVNHPATYKGIRFYQTSFGKEMDYVTIEILDREEKRIFVGDADFSETVAVPERGLTFTVVEYGPEFMDLGPAVRLLVTEGEREYYLWTFVNYPDFDARRGGDVVFVLRDYHEVPYTGVTAVREPGLTPVFIGFILICIGFLFPLSRSMGTFRIRVVSRTDETEITVSGAPGRLSGGFEEGFRRRVQILRKKLC